ncbi:MAG TPA: hypothetical protein PLS67_06285, partial [Accumulibacter sp.]|nr:hypothetical protein [Accumulibacter sp.]
REDVLGKIVSYRDSAHGLPLSWFGCDLQIPSWHSLPFAASAVASGRGCPFHSLGVSPLLIQNDFVLTALSLPRLQKHV